MALTGVEAISDGVPAFKPPEWKNARTTLTWAAIDLRHPVPGDRLPGHQRSASCRIPTSSRRSSACWCARSPADGPILILAQVATALLLVLAANTSFADFPRLSSFLARDGFLPRQFAFRGERLAFTTGIMALAGHGHRCCWSSFQASVSGLIPLYTLGVFIAFTLSQTGHAAALVPAPRGRAGVRGTAHQRARRGDHRAW